MKTYDLVVMFIIMISNMFMGCINREGHEQVEKYENGGIKLIKTEVDTGAANFVCREFYIDGKLKSTYSMRDSLFEGHNINYYQNGAIQSEGNWSNGNKQGYFSYYDSLGKIDKIIEFVTVENESITNQVISFSPAGDTLIEKSLYYEYYDIGDTIKNGHPFEFKFVLSGHLFDKAHLRICNFDKSFHLPEKEECEGIKMNDFTTQLTFRKYKLGENIIRGVIINYESKPNSTEIEKHVDIFFEKKFYVVP